MQQGAGLCWANGAQQEGGARAAEAADLSEDKGPAETKAVLRVLPYDLGADLSSRGRRPHKRAGGEAELEHCIAMRIRMRIMINISIKHKA